MSSNYRLRFSRTELLKNKGRVTTPLFDADTLPKEYLERLEDRLCEIITTKTNEEKNDENTGRERD